MTQIKLWPVILPVFGIFLLLLLLRRLLYGVSEMNASDVLFFLRPVSLDEISELLHPDADELHRQTVPYKEFRKIQWKRALLAIRHASDLSTNAMILQRWAQTERKRGGLSPSLQKITLDLVIVCTQCRLVSLIVRAHLHWALLKMAFFPFTAPLNFSSLMRHGGFDLIKFYEKARSCAVEFSLAYDSSDYHDKLMDVL